MRRPAEAPSLSDRPPDPIGLCAHCRHARTVETPRSRFWLCDRSRHDATYARYPRLPMLACPGHAEGSPRPWNDAAAEAP